MGQKEWIVNNEGLKINEYSDFFHELKKKLMNSE